MQPISYARGCGKSEECARDTSLTCCSGNNCNFDAVDNPTDRDATSNTGGTDTSETGSGTGNGTDTDGTGTGTDTDGTDGTGVWDTQIAAIYKHGIMLNPLGSGGSNIHASLALVFFSLVLVLFQFDSIFVKYNL